MALFTPEEKRNLKRASIIGGASTVGTGLFNFGLNTAAGAIENSMERNNMRLQSDLEKGIMDHQMELYRPEAQVQRMRQAGLNAGLMYNNGSMQSGGATGSIGLASPDFAPVQTNPLLLSQMELQDSQAELNREQRITEQKKQYDLEKSALLKEKQSLNEESETEVNKKRLDEIDKRLAEIDANVRNLDSDTELNKQQKEFNDKVNPEKLKQIKADTRNKNASAWRNEIQATYESIHGRPMSNGMNSLIDRVSEYLLGSPKFQEWQQNMTSDVTTEWNAIERLTHIFDEIVGGNDKSWWEYAWPLASFLYRIYSGFTTLK